MERVVDVYLTWSNKVRKESTVDRRGMSQCKSSPGAEGGCKDSKEQSQMCTQGRGALHIRLVSMALASPGSSEKQSHGQSQRGAGARRGRSHPARAGHSRHTSLSRSATKSQVCSWTKLILADGNEEEEI